MSRFVKLSYEGFTARRESLQLLCTVMTSTEDISEMVRGAERDRKQARFGAYAWLVLAANLLVILWGAVVRTVGAGAGCGNHWPLCDGLTAPVPHLKTLIEFGHRFTSGIALLMVVALVVFACQAFPKGDRVRKAAAWALGFELLEGLIGAGLVLLGHVAENKSVARGYSLGLHLTNTLLLLAALTLTARFATRVHVRWTGTRSLRPLLGLAAVGVFLIGISGAITALGDTLFRSSTLAEGMRQDFEPSSHPFVRLRIWHPMIAIVLGIFIIALAVHVFTSRPTSSARSRRLSWWLISITTLQLLLGGVNLVLMAPVPIQLGHLLLADLLWITFVLLAVESLETSKARVQGGMDMFIAGIAGSTGRSHSSGLSDLKFP